MLLMLMMLPLPRAAMPGANAATRKYGARTLLANSASNVSGFRSAVGAEPGEAGVVDQHVHLAGRVGEPLMAAGSARSAAAKLPRRPPCSIPSTTCAAATCVPPVHDHAQAVGGELLGDRAAHARRGAGYQRTLGAVVAIALLIRHFVLLGIRTRAFTLSDRSVCLIATRGPRHRDRTSWRTFR